jgi:hypothetical protein
MSGCPNCGCEVVTHACTRSLCDDTANPMTRIGEEQSAVERVRKAHDIAGLRRVTAHMTDTTDQLYRQRWDEYDASEAAFTEALAALAVPASEEVELITQDELRSMFGDYIPMEAAIIIAEDLGPAETRKRLAALAVPASEDVETFSRRLLAVGNVASTRDFAITPQERLTIQQAAVLLCRLDAERGEIEIQWDGAYKLLQSERDTLTAELATLRAVPDEVAVERWMPLAKRMVKEFYTLHLINTQKPLEQYIASTFAAALRGADKDDTAGKGR